MGKIVVIGHKAPDTDSVCSPIVYAWYLNQSGHEAESFIAGKLNRETEFVLKRFGIEKPELKESLAEGEEFILLDTNNPDELIDGFENAKLLEVIDHHKLSGLKTDSPLKITMKPVGCTATLVYEIVKESTLPEEMAGLLLAAILSDTLKFMSPTTADEDQKAAEELAGIAKVDMEELAKKMFEAKSDLAGMDARDILLMDSKVFDMNGKRVRVSTLETTNPGNAKNMKKDLVNAMAAIKSGEKLDGMYFFVVDILASNAQALTETDQEKEILSNAFGRAYEDFVLLEGVVSRKKQIVPNLEGAYKD